MKKLLFGTAGIPLSAKEQSSENGVARVRELGLDAMELQFVRGVRMKREKAEIIRKIAIDRNVVLTAHGPYYINLNSAEKVKVEASIKRILDAARMTNLCGGYSMVFHAAYYMKKEPLAVYNTVKRNLEKVIESLKYENNSIWIRLETTGKRTQFGTLDEILDLSQELKNIMPCVDFAHLHARTNGKNNTYDEFSGMLEDIETALGKNGLNNMHIHVSGIEYNETGERRHLDLRKSDMKYKELMKALKDFKVKGVLICESPNIEEDALLMKRVYGGV